MVTIERVDLSGVENLRVAVQLMRRGQGEGAIPRDRPGLTGDEDAFFAYAATPFDDRTVVGVAVFYQPEGHGKIWLDILFVARPFRRRGIARALLEAVSAEARATGVSMIAFGTIATNAAMQALARDAGFAVSALVFERDAGKTAGGAAT